MLLRLGHVDERVVRTDAEWREFFDLYHHPYGMRNGRLRFRDDSRNEWRPWKPVVGSPVTALTQRLQRLGFMPYASHDGVFGYVTQAAVRLFQEYVRTVTYPEQHAAAAAAPPCWPDGVVGRHTYYYLDRMEQEGGYARWAGGSLPTPDYTDWLRTLAEVREYYLTHGTELTAQLRTLDQRGDTLLPENWMVSGARPQLVGLRHHRTTPRAGTERRPPDDLFVLLVNGCSFYFWGSTDANPADRREAYLTEGQHRYRFNWHNISPARCDRIYKAARPAGRGVLVLRDVHGDNALTARNRRDGLDPLPNPTINIHWSGLGISNWSAGCQVISGGSYLNDQGTLIDCRPFTARTDRERGQQRSSSGPRLGMGAYNLLSDLLLCYTPPQPEGEKPTFRYTLLDEALQRQVPGLDRRAQRRLLNLEPA